MQYNEWKTCIVLRHTQDKVIYLSPGNRKGGRLIVIKLHEIPPKMAKHKHTHRHTHSHFYLICVNVGSMVSSYKFFIFNGEQLSNQAQTQLH